MPGDVASGGRSLIGGGAVLAVKIGAAALSFGLAVAIPRAFGRDATGVFFLGLTVVVVVGTLTAMGLDRAIVRFVSVAAGSGDWPAAKALYRQSNAAAAAAAIAAGAGLWLAAPWLAETVFGDVQLGPVLRTMALAVPAVALLAIHAAALRGAGRPVAADLAGVVAVPLGLLVYVVVAGDTGGISRAATAYVITGFVALGAAAAWWRRSTPRTTAQSFPFRRLMTTARPLLVVTSMGLVVTWSDILMLGAFVTAGDVAVYIVASRTARVLATSLAAANAIVEPQIALLHSQGRIAEIGSLARRASAVLAVVTAPAALVLVVFRAQVLELFGPGFEAGAAALVILVGAEFVNVSAGGVGPILSMTGNERSFQHAATGAAAANIALNLALIPRFGVTGAAIATASTVVAMNAVAVWLIHRRLGVVAVPIVRLAGRG